MARQVTASGRLPGFLATGLEHAAGNTSAESSALRSTRRFDRICRPQRRTTRVSRAWRYLVPGAFERRAMEAGGCTLRVGVRNPAEEEQLDQQHTHGDAAEPGPGGLQMLSDQADVHDVNTANFR